MSTPVDTADTTVGRSPDQPAGFLGRSARRWGLLGLGLVVAVALPWFVYPPVAIDIISCV